LEDHTRQLRKRLSALDSPRFTRARVSAVESLHREYGQQVPLLLDAGRVTL
jgi:hypothetical protein